MRQVKRTLHAGLVFSLALLIFGGPTESRAESGHALDSTPKKYNSAIQAAGYIVSKPIPLWGINVGSKDTVAKWGIIVGTKDHVVNLSKGEIVYIQLQPGKEVKPGDRFTIMQPGKTVTHPITKEEIGLLMTIPGGLVILEGKNQIATAKIHESVRPIFRGDLIVVPAPGHGEAGPISSSKKIEGTIIFSQEGVENISSNEIVFIDRGSQDGVVTGDLFRIYQLSSDIEESLKDSPSPLPWNKVGKAIVVSVQEKTSAALITFSSQAIHVGDLATSGPE